jgi:tRNA dimethylallyltransferase
VGGSGLYIKALLEGIFPHAKADWKLRRRLYQQAQDKGKEELYQRLKEVDPETASKLHSQDVRRVVRALEVWEISGVAMSKLKEQREGISKLYSLKIFGLIRERKELYQRINQRVDRMFDDGLVSEVKRLLQLKLSHSARQVLGYKEVKGFLEGQYSLEEAKRLLKRNTRRFAKRQLCWFRRDKRIIWIKINEGQSAGEVANILRCKMMFKKLLNSKL